MTRIAETSNLLCARLIVTAAILVSIVFLPNLQAVAQQARILHNFLGNDADGYSPQATMIFDKAGNLYGTSLGGGSFGYGAVFELSPKAGGDWTERTLHSFNLNGSDGAEIYAGLVLDASGDIYGTSYAGGAHGVGTVFELIPQTSGAWVEEILYSFADTSTSGGVPFGGLVFDSKGNLYGTAEVGGTGTNCAVTYIGCGIVYELTPKPGGGWAQRVLYSFGNTATDGCFADGALVFDATGDLYGVTSSCGAYSGGMVFELTRGADKKWTEKDLHDFNVGAMDGYSPFAGLVFDKTGNLYGTTLEGGAYGGGTVYELTPTTGEGWTETILYSFGANSGDGAHPYYGTLKLDVEGNIYGTVGSGGLDSGGTAFKLTPSVGSIWTETTLVDFTQALGQNPYGGLTFDGKGNLYGTASMGGSSAGGTVFEIVP